MKDLKTEYQKLTEDNVPDLWDRIEAGIDKIEMEQSQENKAINITNINDVIVSNPSKKKNRMKAYMPIIAAAAMLIFSFGIYTLMRSGKSMNATTAHYITDSAACSEEYYEDAACEAASDVAYEETAEEASDVAYEETAEAASDVACEETAEAASEASYEDEVVDAFSGVYEDSSLNGAEDTKAAEDSIKSVAANANTSANQKEISGIITLMDNDSFAIITNEDGEEYRIYIPDRDYEKVKELSDSQAVINVQLEKVDAKLSATFPKDYAEVEWVLSEIKIQ